MNDATRRPPVLLIVSTRPPAHEPQPSARLAAIECRSVRIVRRGRGMALAIDSTRSGRKSAAEPDASELAEAGRLLSAGVFADPSQDVVAVASDEPAALALWHAVRGLSHVLAVSSLDAAERAIASLATGRTVLDILVPPMFSTERILEEAATPGERAPASAGITLVRASDASPEAWLDFTDDGVTVHLDAVEEASRPAVVEAARTYAARAATPGGTRRLLIGPANYAGQGHAWASAVNTHVAGAKAENVYVYPPASKFVFASDLPMTSIEWQSPRARLGIAADFAAPASHVLIEAGRPIVGTDAPGSDAHGWSVDSTRHDIDALLAGGKHVALLFHGSEVRDPAVHADLDVWSPFRHRANEAFADALAARAAHIMRSVIRDLDLVRFVSTLDLFDYVPDARWLPVVVGPDAFATSPPALESGVPVVAHAPTSSALKGSEWIDPVLARLEGEGVIHYRRFDSIPSPAVPRMLRGVDVLVDQIVLGNPGVLAAEAMAAGRLVVSHLPESVRRRFPEPPPVVEANPGSLEETVRAIAAAPEKYGAIAAAGRTFAHSYHDGRYSARVLSEEFLR